MSLRIDSQPDTLIVLSTEELRHAVIDYVAKEHPDLAGRQAVVTFEDASVTPNKRTRPVSEGCCVHCGLPLDRRGPRDCPACSRAPINEVVLARIVIGA